jgi:uracil-DNA glycosylase family 4
MSNRLTLWKHDVQPNCDACGLFKSVKSPRIKPFGSFYKQILICGEGPGETEDIKGEPFCGETGIFLRETLQTLGIDLVRDCITINAVSCRPTKVIDRQASNRPPTDNEVRHCKPSVLSAIKKYQPKLIILLGKSACKSVLNSGEISAMRGALIPDRTFNCWVMPTFHPSYIKREENRDRAIFGLWRKDLQKAIAAVHNPFPVVNFDITPLYDLDFDKIGAFVKNIKSNGYVVVDWETVGKKPFNDNSRILCCSLTTGGKAIVFPMETLKEKNKHREYEHLVEILKDILLSDKINKIAHNLQFERQWCIKRLGFDFAPPFDCTMLMHYALDEREGTHSLKDRAWLDYGYRDYDAKVKKYKEDMSKCPVPLRFDYCGKDGIFENLLFLEYSSQLHKEESLHYMYKEILLRSIGALNQSEILGFRPDLGMLNTLEKTYVDKIHKIVSEINSLPEVIEYRRTKKLDLDSPPALRDFLYRFCKIPCPKTTEKGNNSVDADALGLIDTPFTKKLCEYREYSTLKSTFLTGIADRVYDDGALHTNYNLHITHTGRLSSDNPNLQNIPKRKHREIRRVFSAPEGMVFLCFDYSQWEVCNIQMYCRDERLGQEIWNGTDFHAHYAKKLYGVNGDHPKLKEFRNNTKTNFTFPCIYLASTATMARGLQLPYDLVDAVKLDFFDRYPNVKNWQNFLLGFYEKHEYVETYFGRRRRAPMTCNMAVNSPVQSTASDFTLMAMNRCIEDKELVTVVEDNVIMDGIIPPLMIHDDLSFIVPEYEVLDYYHRIKQHMTVWDFDFINVPIKIEAKVGYNWCDLHPIETIFDKEDL